MDHITKKLSFYLLLSIAVISNPSCQKESPDLYKPPAATTSDVNHTPVKPYVNMRINNSDNLWIASTFLYSQKKTNEGEVYYLLEAIENSANPGKLTIRLPIEVGEYDLASNQKYSIIYDGCIATKGILKITYFNKNNNLLSGTFSFSCGANSITDGHFVNIPQL